MSSLKGLVMFRIMIQVFYFYNDTVLQVVRSILNDFFRVTFFHLQTAILINNLTRMYKLGHHNCPLALPCPVDFPSDIANKSLSESTATMLWKGKGRRRRASHPAAESSSEQGASEADIDSDSGYCSPKHNNQPAPGTLRDPASGTISVRNALFLFCVCLQFLFLLLVLC